jgi:NADH-quinone oxidoreductase subunit I
MSYWKDIAIGGWSLIEGMGVTVKRLWRPVVTVQYPRRRLQLSQAYRGHIELKRFEDKGTHGCIACEMCQRECPSNVIQVKGVKEAPKGPKTLTSYVIEFHRCSLCGLCVEICPTKTLQYSTEYELVGETRQDCVIDLLVRLKEKESQVQS